MRIYVRPKGDYNPSIAARPLPYVDVVNYARTSIGDVKEQIRRHLQSVKIDELFMKQPDGSYMALSDDRSVAHYSIQPNSILETVSNPLWVAAMQILHFEATMKLNQEFEDRKKRNMWEQSQIRKRTIMSVLYNSKKESDRQPPFFRREDDLNAFLQQLARKGAEMSPITLLCLKNYRIQFEEVDVKQEQDPIGSFVSRYRRILAEEYGGNQTMGYDPDTDPDPSAGINNRKRRKTAPPGGGVSRNKRANPTIGVDLLNKGGAAAGARSRPRKERYCDDCGEDYQTVAAFYCPDCEGGLALCAICCDTIHRGAARRNHQVADISTAPKQTKQYAPEPYKAPFALLVALYSGYNETPKKLSMAEDEVKERAQKLTDTDLNDRQYGKFVSGFDCMDRSLISKGLVQKEDAANPTYALTESGAALAKRLSIYHDAFSRFKLSTNLPVLPDLAQGHPQGTRCKNRNVVLIIDERERDKDRLVAQCRQAGIATQIRELPSGDYIWLLPPVWADKNYSQTIADLEVVLPYMVERKTWDDLANSLRGRRFENQLERMKRCECMLFYVVEGDIDGMRTKPAAPYKRFLENKVSELQLKENVFVNRTSSWKKTAQFLIWMSYLIAEKHRAGQNVGTMTYTEYTAKANSTEVVPVVNLRKNMNIWTADLFIDLLIRDSYGESSFRCHLNNVFSTHARPTLLVIQDLLQYNKMRSKLLKRCGDVFITANRNASECITNCLENTKSQLIHYDITTYWQLYIQVMHHVSVIRTEDDETTKSVQKLYMGEVTRSQDTVVEVVVDHDTRDCSFVKEDYASDSQTFRVMMEQALEESKNTSAPHQHVSEDEYFAVAVKESQVVNRSQSSIDVTTLTDSQQLELALEQSKSIYVEETTTQRGESSSRFNGDLSTLTDSQKLEMALEQSQSIDVVTIQTKDTLSEGFDGITSGLTESQELELALQESRSFCVNETSTPKDPQSKCHITTSHNVGNSVSNDCVGIANEDDDLKLALALSMSEVKGEHFTQSDWSLPEVKHDHFLRTDGNWSDRFSQNADSVAVVKPCHLTQTENSPINTPKFGNCERIAKAVEEDLRCVRREAQAKWRGTAKCVATGKHKHSVSDDELLARTLQHQFDTGYVNVHNSGAFQDDILVSKLQDGFLNADQLKQKSYNLSIGFSSPNKRKADKIFSSDNTADLINTHKQRCLEVPPSHDYSPTAEGKGSNRTLGKDWGILGTLDDDSDDDLPDLPTAEQFIGDSAVDNCKGETGLASNMKCGACQGRGHSRVWKQCPQYWSSAEVERRETQNLKRKQAAEKKVQEKEAALNELRNKEQQLELVSRNVQQQIADVKRGLHGLMNIVGGRPKEPKGGRGRGRGRGQRGRQ